MPEKEITLECTSAAYVDGKIIKQGEVVSHPESRAKKLLSSNRFKVSDKKPVEDEEVIELKTKADYDKALDDLGVKYETDANKDALVKLYEDATAES